ncbi:alpha/beta hydrolase [Rugosimonospora africana]|uniref:Serine esterase n=1 Tax=Rugosimonospora africana TaxID=556532 RepID=A0A8J3QSU9_9ACTN|nr:phospholipase [Rugosimonospora africana]GIH16279.1 serine esterase [Rugosimonospora africana]
MSEEPGSPHVRPEENSRHGRLSVRLRPPVAGDARTGLRHHEGPTGDLLAASYVPAPVDGGPYRLVLLLHGAGGAPRQALDLLLPVADQNRFLLLAPQSSASTWDLILDGYGPDVRRIDRLLEEVVDSYPVEHVTIGGFSDGASYALSLGLTNGDFFDSVLAFSPGFAAPLLTHGQPRVFVSHGTGDSVLPIDRCSRRIVPWLRTLEYGVTYDEFTGGHEVPESIVTSATGWLLSGADASLYPQSPPV